MTKPILDKIFIIISSAMQEEKKVGDQTLYLSSQDIEQYANVNGTIYGIGATAKLTYVINGETKNVEGGDEIATTYLVVANYTRDKTNNIIYHNCYKIDDRDVWITESDQIMAVKKEGKWYGVNEYCLLTEIKESEVTSSTIIIPDTVNDKTLKDRALFVSGDLDAVFEQEVLIEGKYASHYTFSDGQKFIVIKKHRIAGKRVGSKLTPLAA